jgi:hypothetical protein
MADQEMKFSDFEVQYKGDPSVLDRILQQLGSAVLIQSKSTKPMEYEKRHGNYVMRVFGNPGFIKFACENQGYCKVIEEVNSNG